MMDRSKSIFIILILLVIFLGAGYLFSSYYSRPVFCTQDAKLCPDGSYVGRIAPRCEFAQCPEQQPLKITIYCQNDCQPQQVFAGAGALARGCYRNISECQNASSTCSVNDSSGCQSTTSLRTRIDTLQKIQFQYPDQLATNYIHAQDWPPSVTVSNEAFTCTLSSATTTAAMPQISERLISGQNYCVSSLVEGAAGSMYTTYNYKTVKNQRLVNVNFVLRAAQCANYDDPQKTACTNERESFNPDNLVDMIISSLKMNQ